MLFFFIDDSKINFGTPIVMLFCVMASLILVTVNDFMSLFLVLELQSFALYILVAINRNSHISTETGLKYLFMVLLHLVHYYMVLH